MKPVAQAYENLDCWNTKRRRKGESFHWRRFNPSISDVKDLAAFRHLNVVNRERTGLGFGLDDAGVNQELQTQEVFSLLEKKWGSDAVIPLMESFIGLPPRVQVRADDNRLLETDLHDLYLINFALTFARHLAPNSVNLPILEIGPGYGGTAAKLAKLFPGMQFILVDLPPASLLQAFYLDQLFPGDVEVIPVGTHRKSFVSQKRFVICDQDYITKCSPPLAGVINTRSFGEMEHLTVYRYFRLIQRTLTVGGTFMNVNRLSKIGYRFTSYPYDKKWRVAENGPAFAQDLLWHLTTQRLDLPNPSFATWTRSVPMPATPTLVQRMLLQVRRVLTV